MKRDAGHSSAGSCRRVRADDIRQSTRRKLFIVLEQDQEFRIPVAPENGNGVHMLSKHDFDFRGRTVAASNPHHTGDRTGDLTALLKIRVFSHDCEAPVQRKSPDGFIRGAVKPYQLDMQ